MPFDLLMFRFMITFTLCIVQSVKRTCNEHSQNVRLDLVTASSKAFILKMPSPWNFTLHRDHSENRDHSEKLYNEFGGQFILVDSAGPLLLIGVRGNLQASS
jgi:hypothetical protein